MITIPNKIVRRTAKQTLKRKAELREMRKVYTCTMCDTPHYYIGQKPQLCPDCNNMLETP